MLAVEIKHVELAIGNSNCYVLLGRMDARDAAIEILAVRLPNDIVIVGSKGKFRRQVYSVPRGCI